VTLTKTIQRQPQAVQDFTTFPWELGEDLAAVPAGDYFVASESMPYDNADTRGIEELLQLFHASGRFPIVRKARHPQRQRGTLLLPARDKPTVLVYVKTPGMDGNTGAIRVRSHAMDAEVTAEWAKRISVPFAGQSLGPFTAVAFDALLRRRQRRLLTDKEKEEIRARQKRQCNDCGGSLGSDTVFDHIIPLHQATEQTLDHFQAICGQRSTDKTLKEPKPHETALLRSHFAKEL
jgi:hypothetical protein